MSDKITQRKATDYTPDPANANKGTERGARMLDDSVASVGLGRSIVVDKNGVVVAGNKTLQAAVDAGLVDVVEVETAGDKLVVVRRADFDATDADPNNRARRYAYLDNRTGEVSLEWDAEQILADIQAGFDFDGLFSGDEIEALVGELATGEPADDPGANVDAADELLEKWQVERGQVWHIGAHRLMCGDSTDADDVTRLMDGEKADAVVTDPPYSSGARTATAIASRNAGMNRGARWNAKPITNDQMTSTGFQWLLRKVGGICYEFLTDGGGFVSFIDWRQYPQLYGAIEALNFRVNNLLVWNKMHFSLGSTFRNQHELAIYASKGMPNVYDNGTPNVLSFPRLSESSQHPTEKPVELLVAIVRVLADNNHIVFDPFVGSGTTLVACEQTGRRGYGMEIEPKYCAVTLERLAGMGLEPVLVNPTKPTV